MGRLGNLDRNDGRSPWHYADVMRPISNFLAVDPFTLIFGDWATGVVAASYGGYVAAVRDTWRAMTAGEWVGPKLAGGPTPNRFGEVGFSKMTIDGRRQLEGLRYFYERDLVRFPNTSKRAGTPPTLGNMGWRYRQIPTGRNY